MEAIIILLALGLLAAGFVIPIIALVKSLDAAKRISDLERQVNALKAAINLPASKAAAAEEVYRPPVAQKPEEIPAAPVFTSISEPEPAAIPEPEAEQLAVTHWEPKPMPAKERKPSRTREEWEEMIGGNIFNWIGAIAILIGIAFFLKLAFERDMITPWMRVAIGYAIGASLLIAGRRFHHKGAQIFAQGLIGGGISILYLSVYASYNLYHLIDSQVLALALMSAVTAIAVTQSVKYNSIAITLLGLIGGFLTPLLLSGGKAGGEASASGLLAYIVLLDIGLLTVALKKDSWAVIDPLALLGTYVTYFVWHDMYYKSGNLPISVTFLTIFWALFFAVDVYRNAKSITTYAVIRSVVSCIGAVLYYIAMYVVINPQYHKQMPLVTLAIGAVYFLTAQVLVHRNNDNTIVPRYILTAIALLVVATAIQYTGFDRVAYWALEALALVWCGFYWQKGYVKASALWLFHIAFLVMLFTKGALEWDSLNTFHLILNERCLAFLALAAAAAFGAVMFSRSNEESDKQTSIVLHYYWCAILFVLFTVETIDYFRKLMIGKESLKSAYGFTRYMALTMVWTLYSITLVWNGLRKKLSSLIYSGLAMLILGVGFISISGIEFEPISSFIPVANIRAAAFLMVIAGLFIHKNFLGKHREERPWIGKASGVFDLVISLLGFELLTVETADYFHKFMMGHTTWALGIDAGLAKALMLAAVWTAYSILLVYYGMRANSKTYMYSGMVALALGVCTVVFGYKFAPIGGFQPVANIRAIAFAVVIIGVLIQQRILRGRAADYRWIPGMLNIFQIAVSLLIFELVTVEVWDYFARAIALEPIEDHIQRWHSLQQMVLSVTWVVYSILLMAYGIWRRATTLRLAAIIFLELTILKVFIVDMSSLETLYRIFSFIGLGFILILTSYLYQRYKGFIFEPQAAQPVEGEQGDGSQH